MNPRFALRLVPAAERPLAALTIAERRIKCVEPRDFKSQPWLIGEGARFWTPERIARLAAENETMRKARKARK